MMTLRRRFGYRERVRGEHRSGRRDGDGTGHSIGHHRPVGQPQRLAVHLPDAVVVRPAHLLRDGPFGRRRRRRRPSPDRRRTRPLPVTPFLLIFFYTSLSLIQSFLIINSSYHFY